MHNKIELRLHKMATHAYDWIQPQQVDSYLNDRISAYVKNKSNMFSQSGKAPFSKNVKNLEDLKSLVVYGKSLPIGKLSDNAYTLELPSNYEYFVQASVNTARSCDFTNRLFPTLLTYTRFNFVFKPSTTLYKITQGTDILFDKGNTTIITDPSAGFMLYNELVTLFKYDLADLYYNPVAANYTVVSNKLDDVVLYYRNDSGGTLTTILPPSGSVGVQIYQKTGSFKTYELALTQIDKYTDYIPHPFAKPAYNRPIGLIHAGVDVGRVGTLRVISDQRFIVSNVELTFIRKPAKVNLHLNVSCDLPPHTHEEIVDNTVLDMLESIESRRVTSKSAINALNE